MAELLGYPPGMVASLEGVKNELAKLKDATKEQQEGWQQSAESAEKLEIAIGKIGKETTKLLDALGNLTLAFKPLTAIAEEIC